MFSPVVYVNSLGGPDDGDRVRQAFGDNYERLAAIKKAYDPDNFFRANENVT
jgi:FAD/FMN-containing dehydrogenase